MTINFAGGVYCKTDMIMYIQLTVTKYEPADPNRMTVLMTEDQSSTQLTD